MTVTLVTQPASMHAFKNSDLDEVHSLSSDYSYSQPALAHNTGLFSFSSQTEPSADLLTGSSWATTVEGPQNFQDFSDNGSAHSGEAEEFIFTSGHATPRGTRVPSQGNWSTSRTTASVTQGGQAMSRVSSSRSSGSSLSQSSHLSNMDFTGNASALQTGTQTGATLHGIDTCLLDPTDGITNQMYWPGYSLDGGLNGDATFSLPDANPLHVVPSHMQLGPDVSLVENSPPSPWDCFSSSISRSSSPNTIEDLWFPNQSPNSSPEIQCQSPRYVAPNRIVTPDPVSYQVDCSSLDRNLPLISEDANGKAMTTFDELPAATSAFTGPRRQNSDGESARDHDLYKKAAPYEDGLYHCPWEGQPSCNHRPEKLKCNYDKFVDSHLKPYRCKAESCEGARFSSTACLLRHEREAHGLHGHGDKPFLCVYEGCERAVPGNGFPRQWNLRDHMKRVHNDHGSSSGSPTTGSAQPAKGRKRKTETAEAQTSHSRKATVKSMPPPPEPKENMTQPLIDQWMEHRKAVESLVRNLIKPEDTQNLQHIGTLQNRLGSMMKLTNDLNAINNPGNTLVGTG
ncbi:uncharacterized protein FPRO_05058 [Fusarium proliferatum ET1]|uniref:C2H2-type domain-containing protein n=1 Tax=Fusarium proliferatum (strain ET1) TaxID=1227346 RepID=A0A1L7VHV2_FUSPR|nr:uncharacterized protein FPRO_05058 [Fusarium proliferatum ET1]CZR40158.1 uncharacterized protein FPRO_05058 [Fusarium proliferatum ET1]